MSVHILKRVQILPISIEEAWDFFSSPLNLADITPAEMNFKTLTAFKPGDKIFKGMLIDYKVSPLFGILQRWQTKITQADAPHLFIDEQKKGPYTYWHHEHHFKSVTEGVEMTDIVKWIVPFGILGDMLNAMLIRKKVEEIFDFRSENLEILFRK